MEEIRTVRQAREQYFRVAGFSEKTYADRWVRLPVGLFSIYLPNPASRKRCIPRHDLHHIITGYKTTWTGEFEMSAWELGAGCGRYWFAWMVNFQAVMLGALFCWRRIAAAFAWGRQETSLYSDITIDDVFLDQPVALLRERLKTTAEAVQVTWGDRLRLGIPIALAWLLTLSLLSLAVAFAIRWFF